MLRPDAHSVRVPAGDWGLQAGFEDADHIESLTEIEPGDQIIIVGQNGLKDKARVRVVNMEPVPETQWTSPAGR